MAAVRHVVVIGAGIAGTAVAERLTAQGCRVTVVERAPDGRPRGSTGHAPGFVGVLGDGEEMTALARASVAAYRAVGGFAAVGALELATTQTGAQRLRQRVGTARAAGLPAELLTVDQALRMAPRMVDPDRVVAAAHLLSDGAADARVITASLRARAEAAGTRFVHGSEVTGFFLHGNRVTGVRTTTGAVAADDVVLACGFWGREVARLAGVTLPLVPIAHPYVFSAPKAPAAAPTPLVRWVEHAVYARDHGDRYGIGTSGHDPVVPPDTGRAELPWQQTLDDAVGRALQLLPPGERWEPATRLNGVQSITPDKRPLVGPLEGVARLWAVQAVWVTHAAGAARLLADLMAGRTVSTSLDPGRFAHLEPEQWQRQALACYRPAAVT